MNTDSFIEAIFITIGLVIFILIGTSIGRSYQQESDITKYCLYQEYEGLTKIDNEYYCYDGDSLFKVEWVK